MNTVARDKTMKKATGKEGFLLALRLPLSWFRETRGLKRGRRERLERRSKSQLWRCFSSRKNDLQRLLRGYRLAIGEARGLATLLRKPSDRDYEQRRWESGDETREKAEKESADRIMESAFGP